MNADKLKYFFECFTTCTHSDILCELALLDLSCNSLDVEGLIVLVSGLNDVNVHLRVLWLN